ncbi:SIR2 family protein [Pseudobutyrivibrio sp.]|uniref:SIR2 family protein n=1 Tax=Pseudobutyrivibrio sp. TaxID=2014367 RepID=UPI0025CD96FB|nr:SIR2 family protein [Pseudobutyrivibrio sp.]
MEWTNEIVDAIALRRSVLFLGAGISANSYSKKDKNVHPPTWKELIEAVIKDINLDIKIVGVINNLIERGDYLTAFEIIVNNVTHERFERALSKKMLEPQFVHDRVHENIFRLDSRVVITPNVDKIYETYAQSESNGTTKVKRYYDSDLISSLKSQDRIILKIHGTLDEPSKIVFTRSEYTNVRYEYSMFYKLLEAMLWNYTFIFLGTGLNDPDIQLMLENASFAFPGSPKHFFITPEDTVSNVEMEVIGRMRNIEFITYDKSSGHKEFHDAIEKLVELVEARREEIAMSMQW